MNFAITFGSASRLWKIASPFFAFLLVGSAFMLGAIARLGFSLVPVIDKAQLLLLLAFYSSLLAVFWHLARGMIWAIRGFTLNTITTGMRIFVRRVRKARPTSTQRFVRTVWKWPFRLLFGVSLLAFIWMFAALFVDFDWVRPALEVEGLWAILFMVVVASLSLWLAFSEAGSVRYRDFSAQMFVIGATCVLTASLLSGILWIRYLHEAAPRVQMITVDYDVDASIAFPATEGLILFAGADNVARYVPWSQILELRATRVPLPSVSQPSSPPPPYPTGPLRRLVPLLRMNAFSD